MTKEELQNYGRNKTTTTPETTKQEDCRQPPAHARFTHVHSRRRQFGECHHTHNNCHSTTRGTDKIHQLLLNKDYPPDEIERALEAAKKSNGRKKEKRSTFKSVVKLPFVQDRLARDVSRVVRRQFKDVRVVFTSGPSLSEMLV